MADNLHTGSSLEDMLREDAIFEETKEHAIKSTAVHVSELDDAFVEGMLFEHIPEEAEQFNDEFPAPVSE